jgi:transcriptional regulator with XRE-family HTH domain
MKRRRTQHTSPVSGDPLIGLSDTGRERLRELREKRGWSQEKLAARAGVTGAFLCQLETGKSSRCGEQILTAIARELAVQPEYLAGTSDQVAIPVDLPGGRWEVRLHGDSDGRGYLSLVDPETRAPKRGTSPRPARGPSRYGQSVQLLLQLWVHLGAWRSFLLGPAPAANPPFTGPEQERFVRAMSEALAIILAPVATANLGPQGVRLSVMNKAVQAIGELQTAALEAGRAWHSANDSDKTARTSSADR